MNDSKLASLAPFREQLLAAVTAFSAHPAVPAPSRPPLPGEDPVTALVGALSSDVERAIAEPLELFPVCHHSPSSGLHLRQRLGAKKYKVIFLEASEGLEGVLPTLRDCKFPVALQAFSTGGTAFPADWAPLNVVFPLTEFSAEYQAIAFALENPDTKLVFVDRSADHIFQWMPKGDLADHLVSDADDEGDPEVPEAPKVAHGSAIGLQIGNLVPTFDVFLEFLLRNARVKHFSEWWDQYVENAVLGGSYETYREVMFLVGSLIRRLGRRESDREEDRLREKYMWTRMKSYLATEGIAPGDALHVCGAAHTASDVEEFGFRSKTLWEVPAASDAKWLYGVIPSSFLAIEHQFSNPPGTLRLAEQRWQKALAARAIKPFRITKTTDLDAPKAPAKASAKRGAAKSTLGASETTEFPPEPSAGETGHSLFDYLATAPIPSRGDDDELVRWSIDITALARTNGYLTSTADAIAIFQTSKLLAGMRNRDFPTAYDFTDAAVTCLEKDRTPKKRDIRRLCQIMLGGDRIGQVGYASLPPLAQDVYSRLAPLEGPRFQLESSRVQRALMDFKASPELLPCSNVLWMLHYLNKSTCTPIMGERKLGSKPVQESWEVYFPRQQSTIIQLGYEGVTLEHVIEKRLRAKAFDASATTATALAAVEDALLYLRSSRLVTELGVHAIALLEASTGGSEAPDVFERIRKLVHHFRSQPTGLPDWVKTFVTTGYSHYATLLPTSFQDESTSAKEVAAMLAFLFTMESLALSFGCQRSQLLIAIKQAAASPELPPTKLGLLWSAEWLLGLRDIGEIRAFLNTVLDNEMMLPVFPDYVAGFLLALGFTPLVSRLVVELLSKSFARLPETVLLPWLPTLVMALRPFAGDLVPTLMKEVAATFPTSTGALAGWTAPWDMPEPDAVRATNVQHAPTQHTETAKLHPLHPFLRAHPATLDTMALALGESGGWSSAPQAVDATGTRKFAEGIPRAAETGSGTQGSVTDLLRQYPATMDAVSSLLR